MYTAYDLIMKEYEYCRKIAEDIKKHKASRTIQEYANNHSLAEIESPILGGTDGDWVRINFESIYVFLRDDGTEEYQLDFYGEYGAELIIAHSAEEFERAMIMTPSDRLEAEFYMSYGCELDDDLYEWVLPTKDYVEFNNRKEI